MSAGAPNFSPSLTLAGLDYIAPSAACIKPTLINNNDGSSSGGAAGTRGVVGLKKGGNQISSGGADGLHPGVVKITLQDCLACSGCVTTAETVLVNAQSRSEIISALLSGSAPTTTTNARAESPAELELCSVYPCVRPRLVSISPQSCASLAAYLHLSMAEAYALVAGFVRTVLTPDGLLAQTATEAAKAETTAAATSNVKDVAKRNERDDEEAPTATTSTVLSSIPDGIATTATHTSAISDQPRPSSSKSGASAAPQIYVIDLEWAEQLSAALTAQEYNRRREESPDALPMIVSACPGWVCYCEKQGSSLLPHLCPVMSAQGIAGSYAKRTVSANLYHISIQPCFDRKLEAARDSMPLQTSSRQSGDTRLMGEGVETNLFYTDCVLSTAELLEWMREVDPTLPWRGTLDSCCDHSVNGPELTHLTENEVDKMEVKEKEEGSEGNVKISGSHMDPATQSFDAPLPPAGSTFLSVVSAAAHNVAWLAGSGSYHQYVIADRLRRQHNSSSSITTNTTAAAVSSICYEVKRNHNHRLATSAALPGEVFCVGYGFQQIQNIVRGLKKKMPAMRSYTFVELMACPDGCLNGGGQVRPAQQPHNEVLDAVINAYARHLSEERAKARSTQLRKDAGKTIKTVLDSDYEDEKAAQRQRVEFSLVGASAVKFPPLHPFSDATIAAVAPSLGEGLWRCTFRDREKEFAESLNAGNIHSLKW